MNNQTRNHLNLQKHIADQDHIIRVRNAEIAALRKRAEKAERERDEARRHECSDLDAHWRLDETLASLKEANATVASLRAEPRALTADDMTFEDNHAGRDLARERLDGWKTEWERRIKAEKERDKARAGARLAFGRCREAQAERQKVVDELYRIRADEQPRPLTADDIEQLVTQNRYRVADAIRALYPEEPMATDVLAHAVMTALTEPTRPEEKVEAVLHQYWSGDINGDDLANRIVEEMNR